MGNPNGILIIPRHQIALRFIELPSADPSEIEGMVEFQAFKELPCSKEEIIISHKNLGSYKKGFSYVMLAIIQRHLAEEMIAQNPDGIGHIRLETEILYLYLVKEGIAKEDKVIMALHVKKDYSEIMIIDNAKPVFSRGICCLKILSEEIDRSLFSYGKNSSNKQIKELVVICDSDSDIEGIRPCIEDNFSIPVNFYEYKLDLDKLGMLLEIDLLPKGYIDKGISKENARQFFLTCFLLVAAIAMLGSLFIFRIQEKRRTILALSESAGKIQKYADQLFLYLQKTELVKSKKEEGELLIDILKEPYELMPLDILLEDLEYGSAGLLYCKGITGDMSGVFNFIKALERSKHFKKVEVKYAAKRGNKDQEITDFNIACFTH